MERSSARPSDYPEPITHVVQRGSRMTPAYPWKRRLKCDPLPALLASRNEALVYSAQRDLLDKENGPADRIWELPAARALLAKQNQNGAWNYHGGNARIRTRESYDQLETYRVLRELVEKYSMTRAHRSIENAAEFLFSQQAQEGDFRGIAGNQYVPYYSAAIMELLVKAGYQDDTRIKRGFRWLVSMRQDDGGWAFPLRTLGRNLSPGIFRSQTIQPDKSKPFSHLVTGIVLRAFAAHPDYRNSREARVAGELLSSRFFKPDKYPDRQSASFWTSFSYPFWFTDLLSALDSLSVIGTEPDNPHVRKAVEWFEARQTSDGLWRLTLRIMNREKDRDGWIGLAICRVFRRMFRE